MMKKNNTSLYSVILLGALLFGIFYFMMPQNHDRKEASLSEFSTKRALSTVKAIAAKPHFVGSENHEVVAQYLQKELQHLGLETSIQEGFTLTDWGNLTKSKNILARIKGSNSSKALLLLSHYDSAPHSFSKGASDDASGVATIIEGIRVFLHNKTKHKNDIIILFTDAEELGLNGAALFVTQHKWAKEIGMVLNFEARGSSGPSYMLMETNKGNAKMVDAFNDGKTKFPVSNSLMYSIYKMLPNDTDLTVFREEAKIQGYNFAFIDNHFNYHTIQDNYENLDPKTLAHQGTYLVPLLNYFSNSDLNALNSTDDKVYFNVPFNFVSYPFGWIFPMWIGAFVLFGILIFVGLGKRTLRTAEVLKGFLPLLGSLIVAGLVTYFGWKIVLLIYPQYNDILHGFTYNGHDYISGFVSLTLAICFLFYQNQNSKNIKNSEMNQIIAPLFFWLLINLGIAISLEGAGFLIIPVISSLLMLGYFVLTQKSNWFLNIILSIPTLIILVPFIQMFPVGLGLKILVGSAILTVLSFTLLLPVFGSFARKRIWALVFFLIAIGLFFKAHQSSEYVFGKAKPNSLIYVLNATKNKAYWTTYDRNLDEWTKKYLGKNPKNAAEMNDNKLFSKYGSKFTFMANAELKKIAKPNIEFLRDTIIGNQRILKILITPNRKVHRYDIFVNEKMTLHNFKANGSKLVGQKGSLYKRNGKKILSYYVVDNLSLELEFSILKGQKLDMQLMESSFDLTTNPLFKIEKRKDWMIPTPFVLNDAVVILQKIEASEKPTIMVDYLPPKNSSILKDSLQ